MKNLREPLRKIRGGIPRRGEIGSRHRAVFADSLILAFCAVSGCGWDSTVADNVSAAHCGLVCLETIVMETWERFYEE